MNSTKLLILIIALLASFVQSGYVYDEKDDDGNDGNDAGTIVNFDPEILIEYYYTDSFSESFSESLSESESVAFSPVQIMASSDITTSMSLQQLNTQSVKNVFSGALSTQLKLPCTVTGFTGTKKRGNKDTPTTVVANFVVSLPAGATASTVSSTLTSVQNINTQTLTTSVNSGLMAINHSYGITGASAPVATVSVPAGQSPFPTLSSTGSMSGSVSASFTASVSQSASFSLSHSGTGSSSHSVSVSATHTASSSVSGSYSGSFTHSVSVSATHTSSVSHTGSSSLAASVAASTSPKSTPSKEAPTSGASSINFIFTSLLCVLFGTAISAILH